MAKKTTTTTTSAKERPSLIPILKKGGKKAKATPPAPKTPVAEPLSSEVLATPPTEATPVEPATNEVPTATVAVTQTETAPAATPNDTATPEVPRTPKKAAKEAKPKKRSALDAAAQVLAEVKTAMTTSEMIEAMSKAKLWSSPNGQTPAATLYSAILREINTKGDACRFVKTERGKFATKA